MHLERRYCKDTDAPYQSLGVRKADSVIRDIMGNVVTELRNIDVPKGWSQTAVDILAHKYFRKAGVPAATRKIPEKGVPSFLQRSMPHVAALAKLPAEERYGGETSAFAVFDRIAGAWGYWGWKGGYFANEDHARIFVDEIKYMLAAQIAAPNSPQWFNTGLHWAYGIEGAEQGHYYVDPEPRIRLLARATPMSAPSLMRALFSR